ncbi:hypothetical protein ACIPSE_06625 [Streptomyces sp. NPDC090106]|uniref:hypothetical protein n=1 Tax=Streptomyces sp. NPDC090106 TaxID=3365946 RepID=UPI00382FF421
MSTPTVLVHESFNDPHAELWFAEPAGFTAVPMETLLSEPGSPGAENLRTAAAPLLATAHDASDRRQFIERIASAQKLLGALRDVGTVHCSIGLHRDDGEGPDDSDALPLFSLFTISWLETSVAPRGITAARAVTSTPGHSRIEFVELPCGPGTFSESTVAPAPESELPQQPLLQLHAHLPHPDNKRLAVLTLSTGAVVRRAEYRVVLRRIAETVRFENPLECGAGSGRRGAGRVGTRS